MQGQPDSRANPKCQPNSEREKKNQSGLTPRALGSTKTSLNCLKKWHSSRFFLEPNELSRNFEAPKIEMQVSVQDTSVLLNK